MKSERTDVPASRSRLPPLLVQMALRFNTGRQWRRGPSDIYSIGIVLQRTGEATSYDRETDVKSIPPGPHCVNTQLHMPTYILWFRPMFRTRSIVLRAQKNLATHLQRLLTQQRKAPFLDSAYPRQRTGYTLSHLRSSGSGK